MRVEFTLKYDKGAAPGMSWSPGSDSMYSPWGAWSSGDQFIKEERPLEQAGFLLSDRRLVTPDPKIHPRFIESIAVRIGDKTIQATPDAYAVDHDAIFLTLATPAQGAKPLAFDAARPRPYFGVSYTESDGKWGTSVSPMDNSIFVYPDGKTVMVNTTPLFTDRAGVPVGMNFSGMLDTGDAWKGSPESWPSIPAARMETLLKDLETTAASSIPRVELRFRSPRTDDAGIDPYMRGFGMGGENAEITEWNGSGILVDPNTVIVLAGFKPKTTGRLETIVVYGADDKPVKATFAGTLKDYNGFFATLETPMSGVATLYEGDHTSLRGSLLLKANISVVGEQRTGYYWRDRFGGFNLGWRRQLYPQPTTSSSSASGYSWMSGTNPDIDLYYTTDMRLVGVPLSRREKVVTEERWGRSFESQLLASPYLSQLLKDRNSQLDPENRPLSEEEENRLAWLGVELQSMTPDLARENRIVDQTAGGTIGGIITYLYPDSPAAKVGMEVGDVLLRLHIDGQPKPLEVQSDGMGEFGAYFSEMMERIDEIPVEFLDRMPKPWGSAETSLTRALTDIGFGTSFKAEVFRDGKVLSVDMSIEQGPAHYDAAKRFKSNAAGLTVRDLTYEVRRYFQLQPDEPGVIISRIEPGERAAVSGLKPFEIITAVDDKPIRTVEEFKQAIAAGGEFRLNAKRMTTGRIVKLKVIAEAEAKPTADEDADDNGMDFEEP